jgi:hypothetical protein
VTEETLDQLRIRQNETNGGYLEAKTLDTMSQRTVEDDLDEIRTCNPRIEGLKPKLLTGQRDASQELEDEKAVRPQTGLSR